MKQKPGLPSVHVLATTWLVAALLLLSAVIIPARPAAAQVGATAVVNTGTLNVRLGPSPGYPIVGQVVQGDVLILLARDSKASWVKVQTPTGLVGWVSTFYLVPAASYSALPVEAQAEVWAIVSGSANLRSGPGLNYPVILILSENEPIGLMARNRDASWVQARVHGNTLGWIASGLIVPGSSLMALPLASGLPTAPSLPTGPSAAPSTSPTVSTGGIQGDFNIRDCLHTKPGRDHGHVICVDAWEKLTVLGRNADTSWLYVLYNDSLGWAYRPSVNTQNDAAVPNLPVIDPTTAPVGLHAYTGASAVPASGASTPTTPSTSPPGVPTGGIQGDFNIRDCLHTKPGRDHGHVICVDAWEKLTVLGRNADTSWLYVLYNDSLGWAYRPSVNTQNDAAVPNLPVIDPTTAPVGLHAYTATTTIPGGSPAPRPSPGAPVSPALGPASAIVTTPVASVRSGPNSSYPLLGTAPQGTYLTLIGRNASGSWVVVLAPNGLQGWMSSALIEAFIPLGPLPEVAYTPIDTYGTGYVDTGALNIRSGPGLNYSIIGTLRDGERLSLMGRNAYGDWLKVRTSTGLEGWVGSGSVVIDVMLFDLPVLQDGVVIYG